MKAIIKECPHQDLSYWGGAPFPDWIQQHSERCFVIDGVWYMALWVAKI